MVEIQCTSCNTRYRIDERVLPDDTPTFKCSRCGHVFSADRFSVRSKPAERSEAKRELEESGPPLSEEYRPATPAPPGPSLADRLVLRAAERRLRERGGAAKTPAKRPKAFETSDAAERLEGEVSSTVPHPDLAPGAGDEDGTRSAGAAAKAVLGEYLIPPVSTSCEESGGNTLQAKRNERRPGENLRFDFGDDHELEPDAVFDSAPHDDWKVGDEDSPLGPVDSAAVALGSHRIGPGGDTPAAKRAIIPDEAAFLEKSKLHSAGFFLGLFFAVALLFTGASLIISLAPAASTDLLRRLPVLGPGLEAPVPLESMISVGGVEASYESINDGHLALVVSGQAHNASGTALHIVQVGARLVDGGQRELSSGATYCGNALSRKMVAEMNPHEIEFLQRLDPQKSFVLRPADSAPFLLVFIDPPKGVSRLSLAVTKAVPAPLQPNPAQNS